MTSDLTRPDLSIIIVSWNTVGYLRDCINSVITETHTITFEVIVVDNASTDGSVEMVKAEYPQVIIVANEKNLGFPAANNLGIGISRGRYILLLNSDTLVLDGAIQKLVQFMEQHPEAGASGGTLLCQDYTIDPLCFRREYNAGTALAEYMFLPSIRDFLLRPRTKAKTAEVDVLIGAYMIVRREAIQQVGGLDERFFLSAEDVDWTMSIRKGGWKAYYYPDSRIIHFGSQSFKRSWDRGILTSYHSKELLFEKHYRPSELFVLRSAAVAGSLIRWSGWRYRQLKSSGKDQLDAAIRCAAYKQVIMHALRLQSYEMARENLRSDTRTLLGKEQ